MSQDRWLDVRALRARPPGKAGEEPRANYFLFVRAIEEKKLRKLKRLLFEDFEQARFENRRVAEKDVTKANYELLEFDRLAQSPNDGVALKYRYEVLADFVF